MYVRTLPSLVSYFKSNVKGPFSFLAILIVFLPYRSIRFFNILVYLFLNSLVSKLNFSFSIAIARLVFAPEFWNCWFDKTVGVVSIVSGIHSDRHFMAITVGLA